MLINFTRWDPAGMPTLPLPYRADDSFAQSRLPTADLVAPKDRQRLVVVNATCRSAMILGQRDRHPRPSSGCRRHLIFLPN